MNRRQILGGLIATPIAASLWGCASRREARQGAAAAAAAEAPDDAANLALTPGVGLDAPTFDTLAHLQRHTEWVSHPADEVAGLLAPSGFTLVDGLIKPEQSGGQAYVAARGGDVVIAFRGSGSDLPYETARNVVTDIGVVRSVPSELIADPGEALVHSGFYTDYLTFRDSITKRLAAASAAEIYITGFSLGSSLANLCGLDVCLNLGRGATVHMLATPRVGNLAYRLRWEDEVVAALRTTLDEDPVPRVPPHDDDQRGFNHVGRLLGLFYDGSVVPAGKISGKPREADLNEGTVKAHDRDLYQAAISDFRRRFAAGGAFEGSGLGDDPLTEAARVEAQSVLYPGH